MTDCLGWGGSGAPEQQLKTLLVTTKLGKVRPLHPKGLQSCVTLTSPKEKGGKRWASRLERLRCHEQIVYCVYSSLHSTLWGVLCNTLVEMLNMSVEEYRMGRGKLICYLWYSLSPDNWNSLVWKVISVKMEITEKKMGGGRLERRWQKS